MSVRTSDGGTILNEESMVCGFIMDDQMELKFSSSDNYGGSKTAKQSIDIFCKLLSFVIQKAFPDQWMLDHD